MSSSNPEDPSQPISAETESVPITEDSSESGSEIASAKPFAWKAVLLVISLLLAVYMIAVPAVQMLIDSYSNKPMSSKLTELTLLEQIRIQSMSAVVMLLFLAAGASVGSFLNVYIYRLPRHRPLLWPASLCPGCGNKIRGIDNLPIAGWIGLGGKCRQCGTAISSRYPMIEALVGGLFVLFLYRELLSGGKNLPVREPNIYSGVVWIIFYTKWDLVSLYFFHMFVLVILLGWGMIHFDRFRVPKVAIATSVVIAFLIATLVPYLNPTSSDSSYVALSSRIARIGLPASLFVSAIGGLVGLILGTIMQYLFRFPQAIATSDQQDLNSNLVIQKDLYGSKSPQPSRITDAAASLLLVGVVFGPVASVMVALLTIVLHLALASFLMVTGKRQCLPVTLSLFVAAIIHLAFWRQLHQIAMNWFS